jgi:hypothetical protein
VNISGIGMIAPDDTPHYNLVAFDSEGHLAAYGSEIGTKVAMIECSRRLDTQLRVVISDAADNGIYRGKLVAK